MAVTDSGRGRLDEAGSTRATSSLPAHAEVVALLKSASRLRKQLAAVFAAPSDRVERAQAAYDSVRQSIVEAQLRQIETTALKDTTGARLRVGAVANAYPTIADVLAAGTSGLQRLSGVGEATATKVIAAAKTLERSLRENARVRIDVDQRPDEHTALLQALHAYGVVQQSVVPFCEAHDGLPELLDDLMASASIARCRTEWLFTTEQQKEAAANALVGLNRLIASIEADAAQLSAARDALSIPVPSDLWADFERNAATYNGWLIEISGADPDLEALQGYLAAEIAARVNEQVLDTTRLKVSLRGYQAFGARFALAQKRTIIGDEMGLGKTIQALAVAGHLDAAGLIHTLVVCPASVLLNWLRETTRHSVLRSYRLYGPSLAAELDQWHRYGGVAVTTYEAARALELPPDLTLGVLVVDEAHYVKNPAALRTQAVRRLADHAERLLYLTGTPMENRLDEFRSLVSHLQPEILEQLNSPVGASSALFRTAVSPVYLRRNQEDVLEELPELTETDEWVELRGPDADAYRRAVKTRSFTAMRQAAFEPGINGSAKLERLVEIVEEAEANGRKTVVFSFFRSVLDTVVAALGPRAVGPLNGSVAPVARQQMIDEFTERQDRSVLVAQIQAGGVGLNIQAGSVVILTEPQVKPTSEAQAIARCHRMGQTRHVNVHRLLAADTVDQRMLEILGEKQQLFDRYVRESHLKDEAPEAVDVSDLDAARSLAITKENERRIVELERKRLGLEAVNA